MDGFKKGFTLAEVLITLLLIGITASLVIPTVINTINDAEFNANLPRTYSNLSQATKDLVIKNSGNIDIGQAGSTDSSFRNEFCKVMTCIKYDTGVNIFGSNVYKFYKGSDDVSYGTSTPSVQTNNGVILQFNVNTSCTGNGIYSCGSIYADLNGQKQPNMFGKDMYIFLVTRQNGNGSFMLVPAGTPGDTVFTPSTCSIGDGKGCAYTRISNPHNMP